MGSRRSTRASRTSWKASRALRPGVSPERVQRELAALTARLAVENKPSNADWSARVVTLDREVAGLFRPALFALLGASALLLLIACINVANLLLARAVARRREVALRAAIGASRSRLIRLFLTESLVLAVIGAVLGLGIAVASVKGSARLVADSAFRAPKASAWTSPCCCSRRSSPSSRPSRSVSFPPCSCRAPSCRTRSRTARRERARAGEDCAAARSSPKSRSRSMLLSGAGLLIRSVEKLLNVNAGLDPGVVDHDRPPASRRRVSRVGARRSVLLVARAGAAANPEIVGVGHGELPAARSRVGASAYQISDRRSRRSTPRRRNSTLLTKDISPRLRVPVVAGAHSRRRTTRQSPPVVVINETMARQMWPNQNAVGKRIRRRRSPASVRSSRRLVQRRRARDHRRREGHQEQLAAHRRRAGGVLRRATVPELARCISSCAAAATRRVSPRSSGRKCSASIPTLPLGDIKPMDRVLAESVDPPRFVMLLMTAFAALALTLAAVGIYGILTFMVSHRRREIGIRLALGAQPSAMLRMIVREGVGLALIGCAIGVVGAFVGGRALSGFLFSIEPWDPATLGGVLLVVLGVAAVACLVPGRRAAAEDPSSALRVE